MHRKSYCDGIRRRDMLRIGALGALGAGLTLPGILAGQALAAQAAGRPAKDVSLIIVFLQGGMSTIDTWDMKPDAPVEFRGEFRPIGTNVNGVQLCEHLPRLARQMDKLSLVRSFGHDNSSHWRGENTIHTGGDRTSYLLLPIIPPK